jgi:hypothetical protein
MNYATSWAYASMAVIKINSFGFSLGLLLFISACSPVETARVLGFGVRPLKENDKAQVQTVDKDFFTTFREVESILLAMGARNLKTSLKKGYIICDNFSDFFQGKCLDSTEVGFFFSEDGLNKTKLQISSLNSSLSGLVAEKIFTAFGK